MEAWKQSLDRWLTSVPDDGCTEYYEEVTDRLSSEFFNVNEKWATDGNTQFDLWVDKLMMNEVLPSKAARLIERAHAIYIKKNKK